MYTGILVASIQVMYCYCEHNSLVSRYMSHGVSRNQHSLLVQNTVAEMEKHRLSEAWILLESRVRGYE